VSRVVKTKVDKVAPTGSVSGFILISFFTVFREGVETVILYQHSISFASIMNLYILTGLIVGLEIMPSVALLVKNNEEIASKRDFWYNYGYMCLYISDIYEKCIRSFRETNLIPVTPLQYDLPILDENIASKTGIYLILEILAGKVVLVVIYSIGLIYMIAIRPKDKDKKIKKF